MDIEKFKQMLTEHKCVMVEYEPSCEWNNPYKVWYELRDDGTIMECYYGIDRAYPVCNIHDERAMADNFLLNGVMAIEPHTPRIIQML